MAGAARSDGKQGKIVAELKERIGIIVASEGGKIDASLIRKKYAEDFGKEIPKKTKIANFVKEHMSNDFEVIQERSTTFIKCKTKRKHAKSHQLPSGKAMNNVKTKSSLAPNQNHSTIHTYDNESDTRSVTTEPINIQPLNTYENNFPSLNAAPCPSKQVTCPSPQQKSYYGHNPTGIKTNNHVEMATKGISGVNDATIRSEVNRIIDELSKNHYVEIDLVTQRLFEKFNVPNEKKLGNYRKVNDIPGIRELKSKQREVNASIQAFFMVRSVCTLHELDGYLASLFSGAKAYEDLKLGPLVKHRLVYEYFKFPQNVEPPEITTLKVMKYLRAFMRKNGWMNKVNLPEFLEYLQEQMSCESLYDLGVRIESVALMVKCIKRCCSAESTIRRDAEENLMAEIADDIEQQIPRIKKKLLGSSTNDPDALVNQLLNRSPVEILQTLFQYCEKYFQGKTQKKVTAFVEMCTSDKPSRKLFQLALHKACYDLVKPVDDFRNRKGTAEVVEEKLPTANHDSVGAENCPCPSQEELLNEMKLWLVGKAVKSVDLKQLARVEDSILNRYKGFATFRDLGQGSFLQFVSQHKDLEALIAISAHTEDSALGVRKSDVIDLLRQCGVDSDKKKLHKVVYAQYRNLKMTPNETSMDGLIARACEQGSQQHSKISVAYEACLVSDSLDIMPLQDPNEDRKKERVGVLGYQDINAVLACLYQTPLLEDFLTWSEWRTVFQPIYGDLKSFLKNNPRDHNPAEVSHADYPRDLVAIETSSGSLLRITRVTSTDVFLKCAKRGDVIQTSGHLVSLVFQYGGVKKAPIALLASHIKEAFLSLNKEPKYVIRFAIKCLLRLPLLMRDAVAMKVFIEPLKFVFGNSQTPSLALQYCETFEERSCIQSLGIHFGVSEWQQDFMRKFEFTQSRDEEQEDVIDAGREEVELKKLNKSPGQVEKESSSTNQDESVVIENEIDDDGENEHVFTDEKIEWPEDDDGMTTAKEQECRNVVESIRRDDFGIGIEFPPEHRQMMENQRSREGRGLHRLSSELYSKDTHFVLELVQNADDNRYNDNHSTPSIAFFVNVDKIEVCNNEVGFEERNIRALCDVGKSTKGKQRYGYIGQKGIGFKSVFRVTDTPEVHSNGYHIMFDAKSGPTGYILPHWCPAETDDNQALNDWTTRIVLPLKEEMKDAQKRTLIARFHDIQPSLLLFLRRLRQIKIHDEVSKTTREMFRRDCGDKLIEITHSSGVDLWFVVKKELPASFIKEEIENTEIALAFPLPPRSSESSLSLKDVTDFIQAKSLIQQPVFAFLPLRSYGFRFIIQADFDVPSSREDVDKDSAWNQWLRQEIANLFVQAFDEFKIHDCFVGVSSIVQLLQFIPLEDEILDFFKPVTQTILEGISGKQCIPVLTKHSINDLMVNLDVKLSHSETVRDGEVEIKWVYPSQVVVAEDYLIEELISDQILNRYLNKYYLHPDLRAYLHAPLRRVLRIETISSQHLIDIGKTIASEIKVKMDAQQGITTEFFEEFTKWVAKWLCSIYRCLDRERDCSDETLKEIAQINIFPLSKGHCTPIFDQPVFLPLQETIKGEEAKTKASRKAVEIVHRESLSLHPLILKSLDDIGRSQVRKLLERLQVKCLTSRDLIKHHIIPALQASQNSSIKHPDVIHSYIVYIKDQWDLEPGVCDMEELRLCALIKTNKGFVNPSLEPVHFTVEYGNEVNLEKEFPSVPWIVVDKSYISSVKDSCVSWEKFLAALGVVHFLAIERKDVSLTKSQLPSSVWSSLCDFWIQAAGSYVIKDYGSSELEILLTTGSNDELKKLAEMLDRNWDTMYSKYAKDIQYLDEQGKPLGYTSTSFFLILKEKSWLPIRPLKSSSSPQRCCPRDVFMPQPEVINLLGDHALYACPTLGNENFLKDLGIRTSVNFDTLLTELMKWIDDSQGNEDSGFTTSLEHMINVYKFLERNVTNRDERKKQLEAATKDKPVVFVPSIPENKTHPQHAAHKIPGTFLLRKRVYWSDPSNLMHVSQKESLILTYPRRMLNDMCYPESLENFFVNFLKVDPQPNLKEYLNLLESIASQSSLASGPIVDDMMRVYAVIATSLKLHQDEAKTTFVVRNLSNLKVFPTTEERWVSLEEKPLFNDDKLLAKLFREIEFPKKDDDVSHAKAAEEKVHFLKIGLQPKHRKGKRSEEEEAENTRIRKNVEKFFREICGIQSLSECVSHEIISTLSKPGCPALQSFLFSWIPYIQRFLYWKLPDHHETHQDSGMDAALSDVKCFSAEELEVVYRLSTHPKITVSLKKTCGIEKGSNLTLYVTDIELKDTEDIIKELAQYFAPPESVGDLGNFLRVLTHTSENKVENYMESQELSPLPEDVAKWTVHEPPQIPISMTTETSDETPPPPLDSIISLESERSPEIQETDGESRGLQCWPPRSSGPLDVVSGTANKNPAVEQILAVWPPPAPPDAYVPVLNTWQPQAPYDPTHAQDPTSFPNELRNAGNQVEHNSNDQVTLSQPAVQVIQSQPYVSESITNVTANDSHNISNAPSRVSYDNVTRQLRPQYIASHSDVRVELEEVNLGTALRGTELITLANSNAEEIGRWGEECVYILLKHIEVNNQVIWVNESAESGFPYDIVIRRDDVEIFIEVKSTSTSEKHVLEISSREIMCAYEKKENYHLYRVYNAGNAHDCRVARLCNLASNLDTKAVSLFILI